MSEISVLIPTMRRHELHRYLHSYHLYAYYLRIWQLNQVHFGHPSCYPIAIVSASS